MTLKAHQDYSMMFKGRGCHYTQITRHGKSAIKLVNCKATEVRRVYQVCGVTGASSLSSTRCYSYTVMVFLGCFVAQTRVIMFYYLTSSGARGGDNHPSKAPLLLKVLHIV